MEEKGDKGKSRKRRRTNRRQGTKTEMQELGNEKPQGEMGGGKEKRERREKEDEVKYKHPSEETRPN